MAQKKTVLYATDLSTTSEAARDYAVELARRLDADLHVFHALVLFDAGIGDIDTEMERLYDRIESGIDDRLFRQVQVPPESGVRVQLGYERGISAAEEILRYAEAHQVELIVLGTHGRRGLGRWLLGSVAEEVVRRAECPVLTVRGGGGHGPDSVRKILVPYDFSEAATVALRRARDLAATFDAGIEMLHVVELRVQPGFYAGDFGGVHAGYIGPVADDLPRVRAEALGQMRTRFAAGAGPLVPVEFTVRDGRVPSEIVDHASELPADLIVIGTRGLSGWERLALGSVADRVVRGAACPVLTVREGD